MKPGYTKLVVTAAIVVLVIVAGSSAASAQSCPTSPKYLPDFTSNQNCLTLNGIDYDTPSTNTPVSTRQFRLRLRESRLCCGLLQISRHWTGSAWYNTQQPVSGPFSTTFTFQLSGANTDVWLPGTALHS